MSTLNGQELLKTWGETPLYFIISSTSNDGRDEVLRHIDEITEEISGLRQS